MAVGQNAVFDLASSAASSLADKNLRLLTDSVFDKADTDGNGTLSATEAKTAIEKLTSKLGVSVPESALEQAMKAVGKDGSSELDREEFFEVAKRARQRVRNVIFRDRNVLVRALAVASICLVAWAVASIRGGSLQQNAVFGLASSAASSLADKNLRLVTDSVFDKADTDGNGTLSAAEAKTAIEKLAGKLGVSVPEGALGQAMKAVGKVGGSELDREEFFEVAKRARQRVRNVIFRDTNVLVCALAVASICLVAWVVVSIRGRTLS